MSQTKVQLIQGINTSAATTDVLTVRAATSATPFAVTGGLDLANGMMNEKCNITAGKLSDNTNIDGMIHLFTTQETNTSTPNIRVNSSTTLNSSMATGECISVVLMTTAAAGGYSAQLTIDGGNVTENWVGGAAPSAGGASGIDIYAYTIIKTGDAAFTVVANLSTTAAS